MPAKSKTVWEKPAPKGARKTKLTPGSKAKAKAAAKRHGRSKPGLVENINAAKEQNAAAAGEKAAKPKKTKTVTKKKAGAATTKTSSVRGKKAGSKTGKKPAKKMAATRDPRGGLTAAGREEFERKDGSHLRPGVKKGEGKMSPQEMRRKGSWAVRFYGRKGALPPLKDSKGRPTRYALSATAWGESAPGTEAAARRIAAKGRKLLERYRKAKG